MAAELQARIFEWLRMIEDEPVPSDNPKWSYPSRKYPNFQDIYGKLPSIKDEPRRLPSVLRIENTVREGDADVQRLGLSFQQAAHVPQMQGKALGYKKQQCLEFVDPAPCLISSQQAVSKVTRERHGYERRPRSKTKDDHYEYKGKTSHEKDVRDRKNKRRRFLKTNRRHTMNDNFHASNVVRGRLTLQSNMNLGLFQMGKTSSPVKVQGADLTSFSEMKFLSKQTRKGRKAACINQGKEESGNIHWNSPNPNPRAFSSLFNTIGEQARGQARDKFPQGTSVYEHGQMSTMLQAYRDASSRDQDKGSEGLSRTTIPYTWSESIRESSALDDPYKCYTGQLLRVVQRNNEETATIKSTKKYWSLEELRFLLDRRKVFWDTEVYDSVMSTNESCHWRSQAVEEQVPAQTPKRVKNHSTEEDAKRYGATRTLVPNHYDSVFEPPAPRKTSGDTDGVSTEMLHGRLAPVSTQAFEQADIISPPASDFTLYPGTSSLISSSLYIKKPSPVTQSLDSCGLREAKPSTVSAMIWDYDKSPAQCANRAAPLPVEDCALFAQTLSVTCDVIMDPEQDPLYRLPRPQLVDTPMRETSSGAGGSRSIFQVPDDSHGLRDDLASYWLPGTAPETGFFSHGSYDFAEQERYLGIPQPNYAVRSLYFPGQFSKARYSAEETPEVLMLEAESRPTPTMPSGLLDDLLGGLKGFWRQQKLY
ncbi:hypothetical protein BDV26DRAFT_252723 [Aspergillus bertholletiae]|uniref:Uncharacterized protein n=1 Tax=Aspergillus bertholletiae TaxID=1226010 RepID=A0A5N7BM48_9EURO|nr:hypothetical protein BDV26DRAFT_252723 [Aspergillus bertholletiae]